LGIPYKTIAFHTLGCKLNFSETSTISREFIEHGYKQVRFSESADVYLLNTCSVTENADRKCRKAIRKIKLRNPNSIIAVTGCYAQLKPDELSAIPGVNLIVGSEEKFHIPSHIENTYFNGKPVIFHSDVNMVKQFESSYSESERTRAFLKIQDGCDYPCTYCTIPLARGRSRSDTMENVIKQAEQISSLGLKEIVLTGVNVGDFRTSNDETLIDLLINLEEVKGIERIRISSIEPNLLSNEIIEFVRTSQTLVSHFHIPLQSGSNKILKMMQRRYTRKLYEDRINYIHSIHNNACIGADVIVGFPGETDDDFLDTIQFIQNLNIAYLHVFSYSGRDNTPAKMMEDQVDRKVIHDRSVKLHEISLGKRGSFHSHHIGLNKEVLFESFLDGEAIGHTDNYIKVHLKSETDLSNSMKNIRLKPGNAEFMTGEIIG
jgi:threonylcarbamoyladenosine tRNA methylthiotransferase MtaB